MEKMEKMEKKTDANTETKYKYKLLWTTPMEKLENERLGTSKVIDADNDVNAKTLVTHYFRGQGYAPDFGKWTPVQIHIRPGGVWGTTLRYYRVYGNWKTGDSFCACLYRL